MPSAHKDSVREDLYRRVTGNGSRQRASPWMHALARLRGLLVGLTVSLARHRLRELRVEVPVVEEPPRVVPEQHVNRDLRRVGASPRVDEVGRRLLCPRKPEPHQPPDEAGDDGFRCGEGNRLVPSSQDFADQVAVAVDGGADQVAVLRV